METPSDFGDGRGARPRPDQDPVFLMVLVASVVMIVAFIAFLLPVMDASSRAEIIEEVHAPEATILSWMPRGDAEEKTYVIDNYRVTLSTHVHSNGERAVHLRVRAPTGESTSMHGQVGYATPSARFGIGKLDPLSTTKQVIVTSYSGGLHCCTKITVLEVIDGSWRKVQLGLWDGDPLPHFPRDVDGDGTPDFVLKDDRFDYAFAPYTESHKPPRIFNIEGARVVEVGHAARYDPIYEADMKRAQGGCVKGKNAACAAFVANAARLGRREWAWKIMLAHYDRSTDWAFPTKCKVSTVNDVCPPGQSEQFPEFPDALAWFIDDAGYAKQ